jgi:biotin transport system substrate-specific component
VGRDRHLGLWEEQVTALAHSIGRRETGTSAFAWDVVLVVAGALVVYALTQVAIPLEPFSPVPITGQTLGVLLVGGALGAVRGGASLFVYLAMGAAGVPRAFAEGKTGIELLEASSVTGGYLIGFFFAAIIVGWLCQRGWDRSIRSSLGAMLIGDIVIFAIGVAWLANAIGVPATEAMELGLYPFVIGDLIKLFLAAGLLPVTWKLLGSEKTDSSS